MKEQLLHMIKHPKMGAFFTCHSKEHMTKYDVVREDVMFNEDGDLIPARGTPPI